MVSGGPPPGDSGTHSCCGRVLLVPYVVVLSPRLMCGLKERLSSGASGSSSSSVQFYELRLMFLVTALRRELSTQLQQVRPRRLHLSPPQEGGGLLLPASHLVLLFFPPPGGRCVHFHSSSGELSGGPVEGPV